jgi:hypothetical protein
MPLISSGVNFRLPSKIEGIKATFYIKADSRLQIADSRQQTADSRQQIADRRQQIADSR